MKLLECATNSCTKFSSWFEHKIEISVICDMCNKDVAREEAISSHVIEIRGKNTIQEAVNAYFEEQIDLITNVIHALGRVTREKHTF